MQTLAIRRPTISPARRRAQRRLSLVEPVLADEAMIDAWLAGRTANTVEQYSRGMRQFQAWYGAPLATVDKGALEAYSVHLAGQYKPASLKLKLDVLRSFYSYAVGEWPRQFKGNPARRLRLPAIRRHLGAKVIAEPDVLTLVDRAPDAFSRAAVRVLYSSGLRASELCALTWADVFEVADSDGLPAAKLNVMGKGEREREAMISAATWAELRELRQGRPDSAPVFSRDGAAPLTRHQLARIVRRCAKAAGLAKATPHQLRHSHATHSVQHGCDRGLIRAQLGHSSASVTEWYVDLAGNRSSAAYLLV